MRTTTTLLFYFIILVTATDVTLSGVILDELAQPVDNCKVTGWASTAYAEVFSDVNGEFLLQLTGAMEYAITFVPEFSSGLSFESIPKVTKDALDIEMVLKAGERMYGQVYSDGEHTSLINQRVNFYVREEDTRKAISFSSNNTGFFEKNFVVGYYYVQVTGGTGSLYGANSTYVNVTGEKRVDLSMSTGSSTALSGYVTNEDSTPETEAYLTLRNGTFDIGVSFTNGVGYYAGTVTKGNYTLQITSFVTGASYAVAGVSLQDDMEFLNVTIPPGYIFHGNLKCALPHTYVVFEPVSPEIVSNGFSWGRGIAYNKDYRIILQPGMYHFRAYSPDSSVQESVYTDNILVNSTTVLNYNFSCDSNFFRTDCELSDNEYYCSDDLDVFEPSILHDAARLDGNVVISSKLSIFSPSFDVGKNVYINSNGMIEMENCSFVAQELHIEQGQIQLDNSQVNSPIIVLEESELILLGSQIQGQDFDVSNSIVQMDEGSNITCSGKLILRNESQLVINGQFEDIYIQYDDREGEFSAISAEVPVTAEYTPNMLRISVTRFEPSEIVQSSVEEISSEEISSEEISQEESSEVSSQEQETTLEESSIDEEPVTSQSEVNEETTTSNTDNNSDESTSDSDNTTTDQTEDAISGSPIIDTPIGIILLMIGIALLILIVIIYLICFAATRRRKKEKKEKESLKDKATD